MGDAGAPATNQRRRSRQQVERVSDVLAVGAREPKAPPPSTVGGGLNGDHLRADPIGILHRPEGYGHRAQPPMAGGRHDRDGDQSIAVGPSADQGWRRVLLTRRAEHVAYRQAGTEHGRPPGAGPAHQVSLRPANSSALSRSERNMAGEWRAMGRNGLRTTIFSGFADSVRGFAKPAS